MNRRTGQVATEILKGDAGRHLRRCDSTAEYRGAPHTQARQTSTKGRQETPPWIEAMAARRRKTLVVCRDCHADIHAGRPTRHKYWTLDTGEPDARKRACPVRRGAGGKGPSRTSPAAYPTLKIAATTARAGLCAASRRDRPSPAVFIHGCACSAWAADLKNSLNDSGQSLRNTPDEALRSETIGGWADRAADLIGGGAPSSWMFVCQIHLSGTSRHQVCSPTAAGNPVFFAVRVIFVKRHENDSLSLDAARYLW